MSQLVRPASEADSRSSCRKVARVGEEDAQGWKLGSKSTGRNLTTRSRSVEKSWGDPSVGSSNALIGVQRMNT